MADSKATKTRSIAAMALVGFLPVTILGGFPAEALLIHHHHGYDVHLHTITPNDSKEYLDRWHCEHEHDDRAAEPQAEECSTIVIVLDLPDAALGRRALSGATVVAAASAPIPLLITILADQTAHERSPETLLVSFAPNLRAGGTVASILLSSHALLL